MRRRPLLSEASMQSAEAQIPRLAAQAGRAAHQRAVAHASTTLVMKSANGKLVARQANGVVMVIKDLQASTPSRAGTVLKRRSPSTKKVISR